MVFPLKIFEVIGLSPLKNVVDLCPHLTFSAFFTLRRFFPRKFGVFIDLVFGGSVFVAWTIFSLVIAANFSNLFSFRPVYLYCCSFIYDFYI